MTIAELRAEYESLRIGPKMLAEVRNVVQATVRRYDPQIYGRAASWDDAEEDLVQSVVLDLLLGEGQLDYLMATAVELSDFQNILTFQVRRYLARQRRRTVIDNLLDRAKEVLKEHPFETEGTGRAARHSLTGATVEAREPRDEELMAAARSAALVPRVRFSDQDRAPIVYTRADFARLLRAVATSLPTSFTLHDLARILELVLTDWVAGFLHEFEEAHAKASASLGPEEELMVEETTREILQGCTREHLVVLRRKLENMPDQAIADELSISRPTVIARKREVLEKLRDAMGELPLSVQASVMDRVSGHLATVRLGGGT
jgi:DNA-binding NarL/FixJ family response regulator